MASDLIKVSIAIICNIIRAQNVPISPASGDYKAKETWICI